MISIRLMGLEDIPLGMRLKQQAGWNQTEADWRRFLDLAPEGCFVAEVDGEPVATVTTCVFGAVGWIAMMLVDVRVRGRGVASALMRHALGYLDGEGVQTVRLDATPQGEPVYDKLGFVPDYSLVRYEGVLPDGDPTDVVKPVRPEELHLILELDRSVTNTDRGKLLTRLFQGSPDGFRMVQSDKQCLGFLAIRPGAAALQLGPCSSTSAAAPFLSADACHRYRNRRVYIDVPISNQEAVSLAERIGLRAQRRLMRMHRGQALTERVNMIWASSGPEKG